MLVDSHCHLNFPEFKDNLDAVIQRAKENNVKYMQTICTKLSEFDDILKIANNDDNIFCSVGIHPHNSKDEVDINAEKIIQLTKNDKVIGIGETGLDYFYNHSDKNIQKQSFIEHIKAAQETGLPIIVHTRDADDDTINILQEQMAIKKFTGLIHCFSTSKKLALEAINLGLYISLSGIITFKKAQDIRDTVKELPIDKLLVETDAPFLAPVPFRGKTNEPAFTKHTAEFISDFLDIDKEKFAKITTDNFFKLFTKAKR